LKLTNEFAFGCMLKKLLSIFIVLGTCFTVSAQRKIIIEVYNNYFLPNQVLATEGDTIVWKWREGNHTTTSLEVPFGANNWDNEINPNLREFSYVMKESGEYGYYCKNFGVQDNMSGFIFCAEPNAIAEYDNSIITLKPNISNTIIQIDLFSDATEIEIFDLAGKLIKKFNNQQNTTFLDISNYKNGLYILKVFDRNTQKYYSKKFLKI